MDEGEDEVSIPKNLICRPGTSRENKTGNWRTFRPVCDCEKCNACGTCVLFCPEGIITVSKEEKYQVDLDYCKGCGLCVEVCPFKALTMERER